MQNILFFHVSFSQDWILTKRSDGVLPADWVVNALKDSYKISQTKTRLTECEGIVDSQDEAELYEKIRLLICDRYDLKKDSDVFSVTIEKRESAEEEEIAAEPETETENEAEAEPQVIFAFDK